MKKTVIAIVIAFSILAIFLIAVASAVDSFDPGSVEIKNSQRLNIQTDNRLEISRDFYILTETVEYLQNNAENLKILGVTAEYTEGMTELTVGSGSAMALEFVEKVKMNRESYSVYRLNFGVIMPDAYFDAVAYRAFITFRLNGRDYTVSSSYSAEENVLVPYDAVYELYCDRSDSYTDYYQYSVGDGTYSPTNKLYAMEKILASRLSFEINDGKAVNLMENAYYKCIVHHEYFDGVLTLYLTSADIPEWFIHKLVINGEERYFEIYDGKIKLVV